jgi:hypothetical protein
VHFAYAVFRPTARLTTRLTVRECMHARPAPYACLAQHLQRGVRLRGYSLAVMVRCVQEKLQQQSPATAVREGTTGYDGTLHVSIPS